MPKTVDPVFSSSVLAAADLATALDIDALTQSLAGLEGKVDLSLVKLNINTEKWTEADGYYYYNEVLKPGETTAPLFTTVTFDGTMDNLYQNCTTTISVAAQATQSANNGTSALTATGWPEA